MSRHIYDIYKLYPVVEINESFKKLFNEVREIRKLHPKCYSVQENINLYEILKKIVTEGYYEKDYNQITRAMLFEDVSYKEAISAVEKLIASLVDILKP